jgi:hypothetical protein
MRISVLDPGSVAFLPPGSGTQIRYRYVFFRIPDPAPFFDEILMKLPGTVPVGSVVDPN